MNRRLTALRSRSWFQFFAIMFLMQLLLFTSPINPNKIMTVSASPLTYTDTIWEGGGPFPPNDIPATAWDLTALGSKSITNDPNTPLNVSTLSPDYYNFTVFPYFYFSILIEFNQTNVYNATANNGSILILDNFVADIDIELLAANGTVLGTSRGNSNVEAIGPIYTTTYEVYTINVSAVNPEFGYENIDYSTTYNMSVVFDDEWEALQSNDRFEDIDDPTDGSSDDEIVPGTYSNLRFSGDTHTEYGDEDWYVIWFYNNTAVNITISGYTDPNQATQRGPDLWIYDEDSNETTKNILAYYKDFGDGSPYTELLVFPTNYSGWYYIRVHNSWGTADHYTMDIDSEDSYEFEGIISNNINSTAKKMVAGEYLGMVISKGKDDWYTIEVQEQERIMVDINWFPFYGDLGLSLYQNSSADSLVSSGEPIFNGLRAGPDRANKYTWYYIHVSGDNADPRYYSLTIIVEDIDDWAEDNDLFFNPYILPAKSQVFEPTEADPWAGLFSLKGDQDWFAISLIPGDFLTILIEFEGSEGDLDMALYDGALNPLNTSELSPSNEETVLLSVVNPDIYLFVIYGKSSSYATIGLEYNMTITVQEYDDSFESNDNANTAAPIAEGNFTDLILRDGDDDWFYLYLHENDVIEISLTYFAGTYEIKDTVYLNDIDVDLFDESESFATEDPNAGRTLFNESFVHNVTSSGKYYIVCVIDGSSNAYNLTIDVIETDDLYEDNDVLPDSQLLNVTVNFNETTSTTENNLWIRVLDDDYYYVNIPAGIAIIVEINFALTENLDLDLISSNGTILDSSIQATGNFERVGPYPMNTTYYSIYNVSDIYFRVFMGSGLNTQYSINITVGPEELLITRENVPPTKPKPPIKPFDPWTVLIPLAFWGAIIGGGTAGGLYVAKKTGYLDKGIKKLKGLRRKPPEKPGGGTTGGLEKPGGGTTGGLKKKPP